MDQQQLDQLMNDHETWNQLPRADQDHLIASVFGPPARQPQQEMGPQEPPARQWAGEQAAQAQREAAQPGGGWETAKRMAIPTALGVGASLIPGGKVIQTLAQALAGYVGRKANVGMGLEAPGTTQDVMSAALPAGMVAGGGLLNALAKGTTSEANSLLRMRTPEQLAVDKAELAGKFAEQKAGVLADDEAAQAAHDASEAIRKTDLGEQWQTQKARIEGEAARQQEAARTAQRQQYAGEKAQYQAARIQHGEEALQQANVPFTTNMPRQPASSLYGALKGETTDIPLENLRASQEKFGSLEEAKKQALGFEPNPAIARVSPGEGVAEIPVSPGFDATKLKQALAEQTSGELAQSAPAATVMENIQEVNRLAGAARRAGNGQLEGTLKQHLAALWQDLKDASPATGAKFAAAQATQRREYADETLAEAIQGATRRKQLPGQPLTETLDIGSLLQKLEKLKGDKLFAGSYPPGYLDHFTETLTQLSGNMPTPPTAPQPLKFSPPSPLEKPSFLPQEGPQKAGPLLPPEVIPSAGGKHYGLQIVGGGLGAILGSKVGHPYVGFMAGHQGTSFALAKIAQSPAAQRQLIALSRAGESRISQEQLNRLAILADAERARENAP